MTFTEFRQSLLIERFACPVSEWRPPVGHVLAGAERVRLVERCEDDEEGAA